MIKNFDNNNFDWVDELDIAITVSDLEDKIIYMNSKSKSAFPKTKIGVNLRDCHQKSSNEIIQKLRESGTSNTYTVQEDGIKKLIHQSPWYLDGEIAGLIEFSFEIPNEMKPHNRQP